MSGNKNTIMENKIVCPNCQQEIDVEEVLAHRIEDRYEAKFKIKEKELFGKYSKKEQEIAEKEQELTERDHKIDFLIEEKAAALQLKRKKRLSWRP